MHLYNVQFMDVTGDTKSSVHTHRTFATLDIEAERGCITFYGATSRDEELSDGTKLVVSLTSLEIMLEAALDRVKAEIAATYEGMAS